MDEFSTPQASPKRKKLSATFEIMMFLILTCLSGLVLYRYIDFTPHVDYDFFFSNEDAHYLADTNISKLFTRKDSQIIISVSGNIYSKSYANKIKYLSSVVKTIKGVTGVKSITDGPKDVKDAIESPFWSRLLISDNKESTSVVVIAQGSSYKTTVQKIESLAGVMDEPDFRIKISGFPFIVEQIQKQLQKDLTKFTVLAFLLFATVVVLIFRSWRIFIGIIVTCANASAITFMLSELLNLRVGLLTANLATITFVLTLSQIVYLTFNWKSIRTPDPSARVDEAIRMTCVASFWCMFTTLLGFISLMNVPARPLRELGICGSITTLLSFISVYTIYPSFLRTVNHIEIIQENADNGIYRWLHLIFDKGRVLIIVLIMGTIAFTIPKLWDLNTDPSLLSYFSPQGEIHEGLSYIDKNGGSSPLVLVVSDKNGQTLDSNEIYQRLWELQQDMEQQHDVGTIISLPTLMAEGKRLPLSFLLNWNWFFRALDQPQYDYIAKSFISNDRKSGLFLLRMKENGRHTTRVDVVSELGQIIDRHGFTPTLVGGIYALQGHLSTLVAESLIYSLGGLIGVFALIAFTFGRSLRISLAMTISIGIIPLCVLGLIGYFQVPLDTIAAPAVNVAIGMGIDSMIHMVNIFHRSKHIPSNPERWAHVARQMWQPIMTSMMIICAGFGIFFMSSFPPTQRFGGTIVFGSLIAAFVAIYIFPLLAKGRK